MKQKLWMALLCIMLAASCAFGFAACDNAPGHDDSDPSITIPDGGNQEPHEHTYGEWVIEREATCMSDGTRVQTCRTCMDEQTETIPALGHRFVNGVCDRCGAADPSVPPEPVQDLQYQFNGSGYTVTGIGTMSDAVLTIPSTYLGHLVTAIGESAFAGITWLSEVTIPNGVTSIGNNAFSGCTGLERIDLPEEVTSIGFTVFYGCTGLTSVEIPYGVTSIGGHAFSGCTGLTGIVIPSSVTEIGNSAFNGCTGLTSVEIPYGVTSIGGYAFSGCIGLTSIDIPVSVTEIGNSAFNSCTGFTSIEIPDSVTEIGRNAFYGCTRLERIVIPGCVTRMNDHFAGCTGLKNVVISDGVTKIANGAFEGLTSLETIDIPRSVTSIGSGAFRSCTGLVSIVVEEGNPVYHSAGNCLIETQSKTLLVGCKNSIIPDDGSVTSIGGGAFGFCTGLTSIVIPESVTEIGSAAFSGCTALQSVVSEHPEGWRYARSGDEISSEDLSDPAVAASLLAGEHAYYGMWERYEW